MRTQPIEHEEWDPLETGESEEEIHSDNSRWDTLLASSESQKLLETMARQAREQFRAGQTKPKQKSGLLTPSGLDSPLFFC